MKKKLYFCEACGIRIQNPDKCEECGHSEIKETREFWHEKIKALIQAVVKSIKTMLSGYRKLILEFVLVKDIFKISINSIISNMKNSPKIRIVGFWGYLSYLLLSA